MNLPNKLTILRILLVPVFFALLVADFPGHCILALAVFVIASLTDMIDGKIARKYGLITDFGKFMDPLADKLLTTAALIGFMQWGFGYYGFGWITLIVLAREFLVTSLRLSAAAEGRVIAANMWGKVKTVSQMVAIIIMLIYTVFADPVLSGFNLNRTLCDIFMYVGIIAMWISAAFAVISGIIYFKENSGFINTGK